MDFITDRSVRCKDCNGRLVLSVENEEVVSRSLVQIDADTFVCKDKDECLTNLINENCEVEDELMLEMLKKAGIDTDPFEDIQ